MNHRSRPETREAAREPRLREHSFGWRIFEIASIALAVLVIASVLWLAIDVLMLLFAAILLATVLRAPSDALSTHARLPPALALALVVVTTLVVVAALLWTLAPQLGEQLARLIDNLGSTIRQLQRSTGFGEWAEELAQDIDLRGMLPSPAGLIGGATGLISSTFGALANVVIIVVLGVYLAANPSVYVEGVSALVPRHKRARVRETLWSIGVTLRWWLIGQLFSMTVVGVLTYVGLTLLDVPLALVLAAIAFLLTFIPFLGPIISGIPVLLVAFSEGVETGLAALMLYTVIQSLEGYVLTPLVQRRAVALPPALTVTAQVLLGVLIGAFGIVLATPLAATGLVAVKMLYVEDILGEEVETPEVEDGRIEEEEEAPPRAPTPVG